ncbi:MAG: tetratricopeptide repeat protein [Kofleriaceae bacterium]|nr:tetratricopeptide repeat protein [Kofleriaceae bacterium]MCL4226566.1 tetratricopeptide repeat protein [Myxococcales bacterium]
MRASSALRHFVAATVVALALALAAGPAWADLATGRDRFIAGDYKAAQAELGRVTGKDRAAARLILVDAQLLVGDTAAAEATAAALARDKDPKVAADGAVALARVLHTVGRHAEARAQLEPLVQREPGHRAARRVLAQVLGGTGQVAAARALWQRTIDEYDRKAIDLDDPQQLFELAEAARALSEFELANDAYREIQNISPQLTEAGVAWAYLFLQKYSSEQAEQTFDEVFKVNPNHPDAHAGMAAVLLESRYDLAAARHHLDKALAVNPRHVRALLVRALIEIDQNQWDAARKTLGLVLAVNPQHTEAFAMLATIAWLRDDLRTFEAEKQKAFAIDPAYAEFHRIVARSAVREHRYAEAVELEKEAVKLRPDYFEAMSGAGLGYLRLGDEQAGLDWLRRSWKGDKYNVRTYNTLNLFEDTIPKEYVFSSTKSFKIRYHKDEQKLLARYLEPMLERAFADMVKRYGFTPKLPVILELYQESDHYSVRTVGLPNLGALGVCFGQVITAMSPTNGDINWGMVLWHELAHVFHIQLSNQRVPRWFTEGLSEYETLLANPAWRRENDADVYGALVEGTLPSVTEINYQFVQPDSQKVVVAYYLSAVMIEYIAQTYGFPAIVKGLKLFGQGKETPEVVEEITGRKVAQFDADFRAYLEVRLAPYQGTFRLPTSGLNDLVALEIAADARPRDAVARARVALGHYYAGDAEKAGAAADAALALDPDQPIATYVMAEIQLRSGASARSRELFEKLIARGHDSFDIRARLAQLARHEQRAADAEQQLCAAKRLDPERSYPYSELAELYQASGRTREALVELEHYVMLEQMQVAPLKELVAGYRKLGEWAKVRTYGEMALYIFPSDADLLLTLGQAYLATGDPRQALYSYDSALLVTPALRRPALAHLGRTRAFLAMGDKVKARAALALAQKTEPAHAEVVELKPKVR